MKSTPSSADLSAFSAPSIALNFAGQELQVSELSVAQVIALAAHTDAIAALDFSDVGALFAKHSQAMLNLLSIALQVPRERILQAKASQLTEALAAVIALNKEFFLQAVQTVVQGAVLKATVAAQVSAAVPLGQMPKAQPSPQQSTGPMPSPPSSPLATESATSSPTLGADTSPTAPPQTITPNPAPVSSSSLPA